MRSVLATMLGLQLVIAPAPAPDQDKAQDLEARLRAVRQKIEELKLEEQDIVEELKRVSKGPTALEKAAKDELNKLQGDWRLVAYEGDGVRNMEGELPRLFEKGGKQFFLSIKGEKLTLGTELLRVEYSWRPGGRRRDLTFCIFPAEKAKAFEITFRSDQGFFRGSFTFQGIYRVEGKRLEVCGVLDLFQEERPKHFTTKRGSWHRLLVYERVK